MSKTNEIPIITKINDGEITNSVTTLKQKNTNIDVYNCQSQYFDNCKLKWDGNKFTVGDPVFVAKDFSLGVTQVNGTYYLNGETAQKKFGFELVTGTHVGEESISDDLINKEHKIKCNDIDISTKFDFVYVQMTTGVSDNFGKDNYRKSSENSFNTAKELKKQCDGKITLGFSHYLTGNPDADPEKIGKDQAHKFLKSILGSESTVSDPEILNGGLRPMVVFLDNITQVGYYGTAPIGLKKNLENF